MHSLISRLNLINISNNICRNRGNLVLNQIAKCSVVSHEADVPSFMDKNKTSKAMKAYLERAREHDEFMKTQNHEFQIGKRHLANMMGEDPENFTQDDIDRAIEYLFPSGLYDKRAKPLMKPPEEVFPQRKAAEFDESGRPHHSMFYTGKPNFFKLLYDISEEVLKLNDFEDKMIKKQKTVDPTLQLDLSGSEWITKEQLENILVEEIKEIEYDNFKNAMDRLASLPYSYRIKDFINKYRKPLMVQTTTYDIPKVQYDKDGRSYITVYECLRKRARGDVTIRAPGTGKISINGQPITYFERMQCREQLIFPLIFTDMIGKVDVEANVAGGGPSGQAGAIRWGIAMGLRSFLDQDVIEKMRLAGLLQRDYRKRERKKPGQEGARRKYTWKKR
jgi:small subunit ribosomal protein S9